MYFTKYKTIKILSYFLAMITLFSSCAQNKTNMQENQPEEIVVENDAYDEYIEGADDENDDIVENLLSEMSLSEKIYQMIFTTPEDVTGVGCVVAAGDTTKKALTKYPVGGIIYFSQNFESREQTIEMIEKTQMYSPIPLFIGVDEEGGIVSRLGSNPEMETEKQPPMSEIGNTGDPKKAYEVGKTLASDLKPLGFNVDFAPDADVLVNPDNTEIGNRSFGSEPELVASMVENAVSGLQDNGVCATLKHFPGHGSTTLNSHSGYSESTRTLDELRNNEFLPFKAGIAAGADFVMISHMTLINATDEKVPCSISKEVIGDMLKDELGYDGIVITDSFKMGAVADEYPPDEAVVSAISAGVDMILMPSDLKGAHDSIQDAVKQGKISEERIDESVRKILKTKYESGILVK